MKNTLSLVFLLLTSACASSQSRNNGREVPRPKLVVGVVVDQLRYDYLYRYYHQYTEGGFKRLMNTGFNCRNHHYDYAPTVTAAGHAAVFTGSVPALNGMVGNEWFSQSLGRVVYCVEDSTTQTVGNQGKAGKMSPRNLLSTTVADQLRIALNFRNKTIGIAQKDRGAILPAGHTANAAYWLDSKDGAWITSSYYKMPELPVWVRDFNAQKIAQRYASDGWRLLMSPEQYQESTPDDQAYETKLAGETKPVFPHDIVATNGNNPLETMRSTPWGNTITKDFAIAALRGENLGRSRFTDFLTVSFSSTDYIGHAFGPNSVEAQDGLLRLDRDLAEFFGFLDSWVGKDNYLLFLTADHGVADVAGFSQQNKIPAGVFDNVKYTKMIKDELKSAFGEGEIVRATDNYQLYLNHNILADKKITVADVHRVVRKTLLKETNPIADVVNLNDIRNSTLPDYLQKYYSNGYNPRRSGDIQLVLEPNWYAGRPTGTTHGVAYNYDTHVPLLMMGWGIKKGETTQRTNISDIAPTIADLLSILEPNACVGKPIQMKSN
jgi:predicted AlkP superfamily pyrophosphatase or phosphodiesterase